MPLEVAQLRSLICLWAAVLPKQLTMQLTPPLLGGSSAFVQLVMTILLMLVQNHPAALQTLSLWPLRIATMLPHLLQILDVVSTYGHQE
jgi:hypothetical protein